MKAMEAMTGEIRQPKQHPAWGSALMALYRRPCKPPLTYCVLVLRTPGALPEGVQPPSYAQARRFLAKLRRRTFQPSPKGSHETT